MAVAVSPWARVARLFTGMAQLQFFPGDPGTPERLIDVSRHAFGQVDRTVRVMNPDRTDELAIDARLICNRADNVTGLHAVSATDFDSITIHPWFRWARALSVSSATSRRAAVAARSCLNRFDRNAHARFVQRDHGPIRASPVSLRSRCLRLG